MPELQAAEAASSADAIKARLEPCQQLFHKFAGSALTSRNAAAQTAAVYAVQHFWHQAGSPPGCAPPAADVDPIPSLLDPTLHAGPGVELVTSRRALSCVLQNTATLPSQYMRPCLDPTSHFCTAAKQSMC